MSSPQGLSAGIFCSSQTDSSSRWKYCACPPAHGWMAPSAIVRAGLAHDQLGVDLEAGAEAVAVLAGAVRRVEREVAGGELLVAAPALRAGQVLAEGELLLLGLLAVARDELHLGHAVGQPQRGLERVGEPALDALPADQAVDDHLDRVLLVAGQVDLLGEVVHLAVDPGPGVALGGEVGQQALVVALAAPHDRRQHLEAGALGQREDPVDDLLRGLAGDDRAVVRAVRHADAGVEQAQVVVDLGDRADRRPGVARRALLVDRDGRREALDEVDVGLVHLPEELPGVGRERLDVAALALGVDRVEGERGLAGTRQAGEDDQPVTGQVERDVAEVVLPGAPDHQLVDHRRSRYRSGVTRWGNACSAAGSGGPP